MIPINEIDFGNENAKTNSESSSNFSPKEVYTFSPFIFFISIYDKLVLKNERKNCLVLCLHSELSWPKS
jgi:hypothetical protein